MSTESAIASGAGAGWRIGLVGYGEVGRILAEDLQGAPSRGVRVDLKLAAGRRRRR
jgi:hypothetical protein